MSTYSNRLSQLFKTYCNVLFGSSTRDISAYIGGRSENNIKCIVHDDLGWKNQTTWYILPLHRLYKWFSQSHSCGIYSVLSRSPSIVSTPCAQKSKPSVFCTIFLKVVNKFPQMLHISCHNSVSCNITR